MNTDFLSKAVITKVYSVNTMYSEKNAHSKRTNRSNSAIVFKNEGETVYMSNGKSYRSNIDNLALLPKGSSYEWVCTSSGHYMIIEFESNIISDEIMTFSVTNSSKLLKIFREMEAYRIIKASMYNVKSIRDTYSILLILAQSDKKYIPAERSEKLDPAINYIAQNYNKKIKNDELANISGMSTVYFRKLFREVIGISPIAYVHEVRIKKAKDMLRSDYGNITDIALSLGYSDVYDFSRVFKKIVGVPPSKYQ